jgi:hypothetical protein
VSQAKTSAATDLAENGSATKSASTLAADFKRLLPKFRAGLRYLKDR